MDKTELKRRTQLFAVNTIKFVEGIRPSGSLKILTNQILRSSTLVGANYRSACKAKSTADFINKIIIVEEESDESIYWFELMEMSGLVGPHLVAPLKKKRTN
ncbi:four helix bundle protein [Mucilaginibacter daejeonensis]|uniref:four helix bundle protein n=1 Tax=Mucilaginibacter daejeonensis TaxID=398049 RepID=UPI001D179FE6|nr:four helix bundle protein [Mucilaginibacter daejeonensis]UEG52520.1 four helix bundle protein [Mucilaginibacter daejeonensis]